MPSEKLSQKLVERITPPQSGKVDYFDTAVPGLMLRVLASGTRTFACRYRDARGKQVERKLGNARALKLSDARQRVVEVQGQLAMGIDPFETRRTLKQVPTFAQFVETAYMPHIQGYKRSWETDETLLRNHILPRIGKLHLDEIKRQHLVEVFSQHREAHKPASTNRVIVLCRYIFNCAIKWEVEGLNRNPTAGIPLYLENNKRERYLKDDEAMRLFRALQASPNPLLPYIIAMLLLTGARKREVLTAKWSDIDLKQRRWRIEFNKTGNTRYVPLSEAMISLLAHLPRQDDNDYLFPSPKTGVPFISVFHSWDSARRKAGLADVRIHDLRHSFASYVINAGRSLYEVQKLLGHTQIKTTQRYAHLSHESLLMAADTASSAVPWESAVKQAEKSSPLAKPAQATAKALPNPESTPVAAATEPSDEEFSEET